MNRFGKLTCVIVCALLANCSRSTENLLAAGLSEEQEILLIQSTIDQIEASENFDPDNFEQLQRQHLATIADEMRDAALANLQKRIDKIMLLGMSQTVELDRESVAFESRIVGPDTIVALVTIEGSRTYTTNNASKTSRALFSLPWVITQDGSELEFRHRGIRMRNIQE